MPSNIHIVPVVPEEEPLAGLLDLLAAVLGQDLRNLLLHLVQRHLSKQPVNHPINHVSHTHTKQNGS